MRFLDPAVAPWGAAVLAAAWAAAFLVGDDPRALAAVPLVLVGVGLVGRRPLGAAALIAAAALVTAVLGAGYGNVDLVPAAALTLFAAGRYVAAAWPGLCVAVVCAVASAARGDLTTGTVTVTGVVFGSAWIFGRIVRRRALAARAAAAEAALLAATDPRAWSEQVALEERRRMAGRAVAILRTAVLDMQSAARSGATSLDAETIQVVRERGAAATAELRELIGLLRDPLPSADEPTAAEDSWTGDLALALLMGAGSVALYAVNPTWVGGALLLVPYLGTAAALGLRRRWPAAACLLAAAALTPLLAATPEAADSLLPLAPAYLLLTWSVVERGRRAERLALAGLVVLALAVAARQGAAGMGFVGCVFAFGALVAVAWGERDRILRAAEERSRAVRQELATASARAVRSERMRLARDLHDVTSHAIGVMVLHAGVAETFRRTDPARARAALTTVREAGERALDDIAGLSAALADEGLAGAAALRDDIAGLAASLQGAGMDITLDIEALPEAPETGTALLRVVQEGLTNAVRHAPGASVRIAACRTDGGYAVRIEDSGRTRRAPALVGGGYGLTGLRERVESCGGSLRAGPRAPAGFAVEAWVPMDSTGPGREQDDAHDQDGRGEHAERERQDRDVAHPR